MQAARGAPLTRSGQAGRDRGPERARRPIGLFAAVAALGLGVDLTSKVLAVNTLADRPAVELLGPYLSLHLVRNPGAAFSTATGFTQVLSVVAIIAAVVVVWVARRLGSTGWAVGLGCLLGGILGNLADRIFRSPGPMRGHVVDFLMFPNFPVFNVADVCINVAAVVIIIQALRGVRVDGSRHSSATGTGSDRAGDR